ncbi:PREDICTED: protein yellow [Dufourea novaeangliae]|uniref:Protein yellow n=1 Tax=Dufourea novaeangliae TaxID=178035 RepID=A0A154P303_DUFNO|nr:PREDICTED: protein yellow [Dufourea novaeangliae]KZC05724.1 Protein yellow [Dufourea novaeangliae]
MKSLICLLSLLVVTTVSHKPFQVIFQWNTLDVVWPSEEEQQYALTHGDYIPANNFIAGIKLWKGKMYLTLPRWRDGVPVTLGVTSATPVNRNTDPNLEAFPSWAMQKIGDCSAFQFVQSMEIDPVGRMWVIDSGRISHLSVETKTVCPPRLVILDLEKNGEVLKSYEFPQNVARHGFAHLNDIVVDHEDGGMAYISDSDREDPGIIVYSLQNNTSWKIRHDSMKAKPEAVRFMIAKALINMPFPVNGIALSPASVKDRQLYYSPLSSFHLYSMPTSVLKSNMSNIDEYVNELGRKNSQSDGMMMSATGVLYFGLLADDAVSLWDTKTSASFNTGQRVISRDHERMQWPDTFAFDEDGNFYCVTNAMQNILNNRVNASMPNYRVVRAETGMKSYQYFEDGTAPEQPVVPTSCANRISLGVAMALAVLLAVVVQ